MARDKVDIANGALGRIGETQFIESFDDNRPAAELAGIHYDNIVREALSMYPWGFALRERKLASIGTQSVTGTGDDLQVRFDIVNPFVDSDQITVTIDDVEQTAGTDYDIVAEQDGEPAHVLFGTAPSAGEVIEITVTLSRVGWGYLFSLPADFLTVVGLVYSDAPFESLSVGARIPYDVVSNDAADGLLFCCNEDCDEGDGFTALRYIANVQHVPAWPAIFASAVMYRLAAEYAAAIRKEPKLATEMMQLYYATLDQAAAIDQNNQLQAEPDSPSIAARG